MILTPQIFDAIANKNAHYKRYKLEFNVETTSDFNVEKTSDLNVETMSDFNVDSF